MSIRPYPEEEKCQNCVYSREIQNNQEKVSCRYSNPEINPPHWPEISKDEWCNNYRYNPKINPIFKEIVYQAIQKPTYRVGNILTFTEEEEIIKKRIKDKYSEAIFPDVYLNVARDVSVF